jgi:hypothetical protein
MLIYLKVNIKYAREYYYKNSFFIKAVLALEL